MEKTKSRRFSLFGGKDKDKDHTKDIPNDSSPPADQTHSSTVDEPDQRDSESHLEDHDGSASAADGSGDTKKKSRRFSLKTIAKLVNPKYKSGVSNSTHSDPAPALNTSPATAATTNGKPAATDATPLPSPTSVTATTANVAQVQAPSQTVEPVATKNDSNPPAELKKADSGRFIMMPRPGSKPPAAASTADSTPAPTAASKAKDQAPIAIPRPPPSRRASLTFGRTFAAKPAADENNESGTLPPPPNRARAPSPNNIPSSDGRRTSSSLYGIPAVSGSFDTGDIGTDEDNRQAVALTAAIAKALKETGNEHLPKSHPTGTIGATATLTYKRRTNTLSGDDGSSWNINEESLRNILFGRVSDLEFFERPKSALHVFVSSGGKDSDAERIILMDKIYPVLKEQGAKEGIDVLFIDLVGTDSSSAVRDNPVDGDIWMRSVEEIQRCYEQSGGMFFLSLQGHKAGFVPLPKFLDKTLFEQRLLSKEITGKANAGELVAVAKEWYRLDENHVPPRYVLKQAAVSKSNRRYLEEVRSMLVEIFGEVNKGESLVLGRSLGEWEAEWALNLDKTGVHWVSREYEVISHDKSNQEYSRIGTDSQVTQIRNRLTDALNDSSSKNHTNVHSIPVLIPQHLSTANLSFDSDEFQNYMERWEENMKQVLENELNDVIELRNRWWKDCGGLLQKMSVVGQETAEEAIFPGRDMDEILHHSRICWEESRRFVGRSREITQVFELLDKKIAAATKKKGANDTSGEDEHLFSSIHCCVSGDEGVGKTAFLAKLASLFYSAPTNTSQSSIVSDDVMIPESLQSLPIIVRFCAHAATPSHLEMMNFISSLILQILWIYNDKLNLTRFLRGRSSWTYSEVCDYFHAVLEHYPVLLLLDSVDSLVGASEEEKVSSGTQNKLSFLRGLKMHPNGCLVVSYTKSSTNSNGIAAPSVPISSSNGYLAALLSSLPHLSLSSFAQQASATASSSLAEKMIHRMLSRQHHRRLTESQMQQVVKTAGVIQDGRALILQLLVQELAQWNSSSNPSASNSLLQSATSLSDFVNALLAILEKKYGEDFVRYALAIIAVARQGISDNEMLDLLSIHHQKLNDDADDGDRFPVYKWLALRKDLVLRGLLVQRPAPSMLWTWSHHSLQQLVLQRFDPSTGPAGTVKLLDIHRSMGLYFTRLLDKDQCDILSISAMQLCFGTVTGTTGVSGSAGGGPSPFDAMSHINERRLYEGYYHLIHGKLYEHACREMCAFEFVCAVCLVKDFINFVNYLQLVIDLTGDGGVDGKKSVNKTMMAARMVCLDYATWLQDNATELLLNPRYYVVKTATTLSADRLVSTHISKRGKLRASILGAPAGGSPTPSAGEDDESHHRVDYARPVWKTVTVEEVKQVVAPITVVPEPVPVVKVSTVVTPAPQPAPTGGLKGLFDTVEPEPAPTPVPVPAPAAPLEAAPAPVAQQEIEVASTSTSDVSDDTAPSTTGSSDHSSSSTVSDRESSQVDDVSAPVDRIPSTPVPATPSKDKQGEVLTPATVETPQSFVASQSAVNSPASPAMSATVGISPAATPVAAPVADSTTATPASVVTAATPQSAGLPHKTSQLSPMVDYGEIYPENENIHFNEDDLRLENDQTHDLTGVADSGSRDNERDMSFFSPDKTRPIIAPTPSKGSGKGSVISASPGGKELYAFYPDESDTITFVDPTHQKVEQITQRVPPAAPATVIVENSAGIAAAGIADSTSESAPVASPPPANPISSVSPVASPATPQNVVMTPMTPVSEGKKSVTSTVNTPITPLVSTPVASVAVATSPSAHSTPVTPLVSTPVETAAVITTPASSTSVAITPAHSTPVVTSLASPAKVASPPASTTVASGSTPNVVSTPLANGSVAATSPTVVTGDSDQDEIDDEVYSESVLSAASPSPAQTSSSSRTPSRTSSFGSGSEMNDVDIDSPPSPPPPPPRSPSPEPVSISPSPIAAPAPVSSPPTPIGCDVFVSVAVDVDSEAYSTSYDASESDLIFSKHFLERMEVMNNETKLFPLRSIISLSSEEARLSGEISHIRSIANATVFMPVISKRSLTASKINASAQEIDFLLVELVTAYLCLDHPDSRLEEVIVILRGFDAIVPLGCKDNDKNMKIFANHLIPTSVIFYATELLSYCQLYADSNMIKALHCMSVSNLIEILCTRCYIRCDTIVTPLSSTVSVNDSGKGEFEEVCAVVLAKLSYTLTMVADDEAEGERHKEKQIQSSRGIVATASVSSTSTSGRRKQHATGLPGYGETPIVDPEVSNPNDKANSSCTIS